MTFCPRCARRLAPREMEGRTRYACPDPSCAFVFYDNPLPVAAALVEHEGKVVLVRQHGWPEKWFGLVTGFIERGESAEDAALRELKEELGLDGHIESLIGVYPFAVRNELIVTFHVTAQGTIALGPELEAFKAVDPAELRAWPFGTGLAVQAWLDKRSR
jgi:NAD+ diphosphatase